MPLEIQRGRSKWFYGRVNVNGRQLSKNLGIEIMGTPPASLRDLGDPAFERSRAKAQAILEKLQIDLKKRARQRNWSRRSMKSVRANGFVRFLWISARLAGRNCLGGVPWRSAICRDRKVASPASSNF
jgi:hypothetical protein